MFIIYIFCKQFFLIEFNSVNIFIINKFNENYKTVETWLHAGIFLKQIIRWNQWNAVGRKMIGIF